jgi:DNA-binding FadR family transcriptional regulator
MSWGAFAVILLLAGTYVAQLSFTQTQLRNESAQIEMQFEQQVSQKESAEKLRTQLEGIAADVAALADAGNANAAQIRDQLEAQGITLRNVTPSRATTQAPTKD